MKTITLEAFQSLIDRPDWQHDSDYEVVERLEQPREDWDPDDDAPMLRHIPHVFGWGVHTATLPGEVTIRYEESFNYDEHDADSFVTGTEGQNEVWFVEGVTVVDEDGDEIDAHSLADYLPGEFQAVDYSGLEVETTTDIDYDETSDMDTFELRIDNEPDLRFTGERIGSAASTDEQALPSSYSGQTGRWTELSLYRTKGGKYICHQIGRTRWQGERDRYSGKVCESVDEVMAFFGHRWLAKELYDEAGIDAAREIE